ncbi:hypothetical protein PQX77_006639 [Marasmius sp. AFHP31]|nr:hypothetical protein PQX77_006639 [Marasmius sp. AFHP31]
MSEFFSNAQNFSIKGGTFSGINGDQHNHYYEKTLQASHLSTSRSGSIAQGTSSRAITTTIHINGNQINNQIVEREEKELTEFDDYRNLKRGDICRLRNICQVRCDEDCHCRSCRRWKQRVMKMICAAKVNGVEGEFTVVSYTGPDAWKVFEEEFHKLSRQLFPEVAQVYAIDKGTIPSVVLWHNLVPLAQLLSNVGDLVQRYLQNLHYQWECGYEEMWIDPTRGVVCRGPKGPPSYILLVELEIKDLPPTSELLQEEVLVRFLVCQKSREADDAFMTATYDAWTSKDIPERVNLPTIFSALTKAPIAVANNVWKSLNDNLMERTCLENGWIRFRLDGDGWLLLRLNRNMEKAWLSQAWSVFHARGVSLDDDVEDFQLVYPKGWLEDYIDDSPSKCQLRQQQPIYLFVYPPPPNLPNGKTSSLHHWSFHEDGHSHISPGSCLDLGLPVNLCFIRSCYSQSWPTNSYKSLHQYQIARGFEPTTADFAKHLGYSHIFQPLDDVDRFDNVHEDQIIACPDTPTTLSGSTITINSELPTPSTADLTQHLANDNYILQPLNVNDRFTEVNEGQGIGSYASHATGSLASADPEVPSNTQDPGLVTSSTFTLDLQAIEDDSITRSQHVIAHKPQETDSRMGALNVSVQVPHHKSGTTSNDDPTLNGQASCPVTPRSLNGGPIIPI